MLKAAQIAGLALESDLCTPLAAALGFVNTPHTAGVVFCDPPASDVLHTGPLDKMFRCKGHVAAAAAGGVSAHEAGLADACLIPAAAPALPVMLFVPLSVIGGHRQFSELFAYPVLERRPAQAPAGSRPAVFKKSQRGVHSITAVAPANPYSIAVFLSLVGFMAVNLPKRMPVRSLFLLMSISTSCRPLSGRTYRSYCTLGKQVGW